MNAETGRPEGGDTEPSEGGETGRPEGGETSRKRVRWLLGGELLGAGAVGGGLSAATGQPVIWVLGGVIGGWLACRLARALNAPAEPSPRVRQLGQLLIGAAIGPGIAAQQFSVSAGDLSLLSAGVAATLLASLLVTKAYCRFGPVDGLTAGMAMLPGGIGIMPSVAAEHGKPVGLVAIVQSVRMTLVLVMALAVFGASGMVHGNGAAHGSGAVQTKALLPGSMPGWLYVAALLTGAVAAAWAAGKLRIPVPTLLGPLLFGCALSLGLRAGGVDPDLLAAPFLQEIVGQVMLGITVGEYLAQRYVGGVPALLGGVAGVAANCGAAMLIAAAIAAVSPWSYLTSLLMVAPGGAPEMVVIAAATNGELALVLAAQTGRQVLVNVLMPFWIHLFTRFDSPGPRVRHDPREPDRAVDPDSPQEPGSDGDRGATGELDNPAT